MANLVQIEDFLDGKGIDYRLVTLDARRFRAKEVMEAGVSPCIVVKTLVVRTVGNITKLERSSHKSNVFVALCLLGQDRVDFKKVRKLFGNRTELATPEEVLKVTGVPIGAVCPVLIGIPVIFDKNVMDLKNIHLGGGAVDKGLEMKLDSLLRIVSHKVEDIKAE